MVGSKSPITIELNDGAPEALPCNTVVDVPREPSVDGAVPAPPPRTIWFAASNADEAIVVVPLKYRTPPDVPDVSPVPPWVTDSVPVAVDKSTVGVLHVPFPVQNVVELAPVPLFK